MRALGALALPLLLRLEPETAHRAAIAVLRLAPAATSEPSDPRFNVKAFGLAFGNPLGMAAGFDKNAEIARGLLGAGFGFVEVGTLTPLPQPGNPRPRLFRLPTDGALINRLGFNNEGYEAAHARLSRSRPRGIIGVNIGPNKDSTDRIADYVLGVRTFADVASYFTINISSPNTPGLRDLQQRGALDELIARVIDTREACAIARPVLVKIAPDVDEATLDDIVAIARARHRRHDRVEYDDWPSRKFDGPARERDRRAFGPAAVRFVDANAGAVFCARRRRPRADRLRRNRRRAGRARQDRSGRQPGATLYGADLSRAEADRRDSERPSDGVDRAGRRADRRCSWDGGERMGDGEGVRAATFDVSAAPHPTFAYAKAPFPRRMRSIRSLPLRGRRGARVPFSREAGEGVMRSMTDEAARR